tara:strand:- start:235 stop:888 length:654 start_codon:yes stop_codon:yes gene_type:complete
MGRPKIKKKMKYDHKKITLEPLMLGSIVMKYELPKRLIDDINSAYDQAKDLPSWNQHLAGKIEEEKLINELMNEDISQVFLSCFLTYMNYIQKNLWTPRLQSVWINEMKVGEYNPFHFHKSPTSYLGLSSVLILKVPNTYGKEITNPENPSNGVLEFIGGSQDTLSVSQLRVNAKVGEFFVFPYTMLHGVYPFYDTNEARRTLSCNCDLLMPEPKEE